MATTPNSRKKRDSNVAAAPGQNGTAPASPPRVEPAILLEHYRKMVLIRIFEEACLRGFRTGKIGGYLHVYIGQEAVATGLLDAIDHEKGDKVITAYRDHAHTMLLGSTPNEIMAELYGKGTGLVKGKGGSMHLFDAENGFLGGYGIVGGHIPLGVGLAYAMRYQGKDSIVQLYLGDGAIHNGAYHEAANLSGLWGREGMNPILFILENNQYGMGTSVHRATAQEDLGSKFDSYGIPHEKVDGMDLEAMLEAAHRATKQIRETGKPYAIEAMTYRLAPHGAADFLEKYRSKDEVREARQRDPIGLLEKTILERDIADEAKLEAIRAEAKKITDEAVRFAEESPEPDLAELTTDVYVDA